MRAFTILSLMALMSGPALAEKPEFNWYGYTQLDLHYDTNNEVFPGGMILRVKPDSDNEDKAHFGATANRSRFGVKIKGLGGGAWKGSAQLEIDFWDNNVNSSKTYGNNGNQPYPRMRLAFGTLHHKGAKLKIHGGQQWDVVSPLNPAMLEMAPMFTTGNQGFRRPMLTLEKIVPFGGGSKMIVEAAVAQIDQGTGETPSYQGGLTLQFPSKVKQKGKNVPFQLALTGGFGGTMGVDDAGKPEEKTSWIGVVSIDAPIVKVFRLKAEGFMGENSGPYLTLGAPETKVRGGWAAVTLGAFSGVSFNLGYGFEEPSDGDVPAEGDKITRNSSAFGNVKFAVTKRVTIGLEGSWWQTKYDAAGTQEDIRVQNSYIYTF